MIQKPSLIIFDVDGVLVDVSGSFHQTVLETVKHFTGKRVTLAELHRWKNRSGYNDDWKLSTAWVQSLGGKFEYDEVKRKFVEIYWGKNGKRGNVRREKWLLSRASLRRLAKNAELALFTGRVWDELDYTLDRCKTRNFFRQIVTAEDVKAAEAGAGRAGHHFERARSQNGGLPWRQCGRCAGEPIRRGSVYRHTAARLDGTAAARAYFAKIRRRGHSGRNYGVRELAEEKVIPISPLEP